MPISSIIRNVDFKTEVFWGQALMMTPNITLMVVDYEQLSFIQDDITKEVCS